MNRSGAGSPEYSRPWRSLRKKSHSSNDVAASSLDRNGRGALVSLNSVTLISEFYSLFGGYFHSQTPSPCRPCQASRQHLFYRVFHRLRRPVSVSLPPCCRPLSRASCSKRSARFVNLTRRRDDDECLAKRPAHCVAQSAKKNPARKRAQPGRRK